VAFSSNGKHLVSGSGDMTVRVWDVLTATPKSTLRGHSNWVMAVAFSPDGSRIASGDLNGNVLIWDPVTGKQCGKSLKGHKKHVTSLVWEPMHTDPRCIRVASASKDGTIKIWDILRHTCTISLSGHSNTVKCIKWGGEGLLYSASSDRCIKVWETTMGKLVRTLVGHAHWVNTLSLNTEHALRTGPYDHKGNAPTEPDEVQQRCKDKYMAVLAMGAKRELLVSGSDDFTLLLWDPTREKKPMNRLTGHQQPINFVQYSPDGSCLPPTCLFPFSQQNKVLQNIFYY
jgi:ribosome assembly protein 4